MSTIGDISRQFLIGQEGTWCGIKVTVKAYQDAPGAALLYCSFRHAGKLEFEWLDAGQVNFEVNR